MEVILDLSLEENALCDDSLAPVSVGNNTMLEEQAPVSPCALDRVGTSPDIVEVAIKQEDEHETPGYEPRVKSREFWIPRDVSNRNYYTTILRRIMEVDVDEIAHIRYINEPTAELTVRTGYFSLVVSNANAHPNNKNTLQTAQSKSRRKEVKCVCGGELELLVAAGPVSDRLAAVNPGLKGAYLHRFSVRGPQVKDNVELVLFYSSSQSRVKQKTEFIKDLTVEGVEPNPGPENYIGSNTYVDNDSNPRIMYRFFDFEDELLVSNFVWVDYYWKYSGIVTYSCDLSGLFGWIRDLTEEGIEPNPGPPPVAKATYAQKAKAAIDCHNCGKPGHKKFDCKAPKAPKGSILKKGTREGKKSKAVSQSLALDQAQTAGHIDALRTIIKDLREVIVDESEEKDDSLPDDFIGPRPRPNDYPVDPTDDPEVGRMMSLLRSAQNMKIRVHNRARENLWKHTLIPLMCGLMSIILLILAIASTIDAAHGTNSMPTLRRSMEFESHDGNAHKFVAFWSYLFFVLFGAIFLYLYRPRHLIFSADFIKFKNITVSALIDSRADAIALQKMKHSPLMAEVSYSEHGAIFFGMITYVKRNQILVVSLETFVQITHAKNLSLCLNEKDAWAALYHSAQTLQSVNVDRNDVLSDVLTVQHTAVLSQLKYVEMMQKCEWMLFPKPAQ